MRRGIRHGRLLQQNGPFMHEMVVEVVSVMAVAYPELHAASERIAKVVLAEEEQFARVLEFGAKLLDVAIGKTRHSAVASVLTGLAEQFAFLKEPGLQEKFIDLYLNFALISSRARFNSDERLDAVKSLIPMKDMVPFYTAFRVRLLAPALSGNEAFRLYETYGLPRDFIEDTCRDENVKFDGGGFDVARMLEQQRARASWKGGSQKSASPAFRELPKTEFEGYTAAARRRRSHTGSRKRWPWSSSTGGRRDWRGRARRHQLLRRLRRPGRRHRPPLRIRSQHRDRGCPRRQPSPCRGVFAHSIVVKQPLAVGDVVDTVVDRENRLATERKPHRHPPAPRGFARGPGQARQASRFAQRPHAPALRLFSLCKPSQSRSFARLNRS